MWIQIIWLRLKDNLKKKRKEKKEGVGKGKSREEQSSFFSPCILNTLGATEDTHGEVPGFPINEILHSSKGIEEDKELRERTSSNWRPLLFLFSKCCSSTIFIQKTWSFYLTITNSNKDLHNHNVWELSLLIFILESSRCSAAEMNPTGNHEVVGSIPALIQWVKDLTLLYGCGVSQQQQLRSDP